MSTPRPTCLAPSLHLLAAWPVVPRQRERARGQRISRGRGDVRRKKSIRVAGGGQHGADGSTDECGSARPAPEAIYVSDADGYYLLYYRVQRRIASKSSSNVVIFFRGMAWHRRRTHSTNDSVLLTTNPEFQTDTTLCCVF